MRPLAQLPWSLFVIALTLASTSASAPVHRNPEAPLTPQNFQETIAEGVWLIELFSPYCHHCRDFAPTWQKLVDDTENASDPGIKLAQVNCAVNGDLCDEHFVKGYPQLNIYQDGKFIEWYTGRRDYDLLTEYMSKHAENLMESKHAQSVVESNPSGRVMVINHSNFQSVVDQGPVFIKFFAPWCGHCKKLAPTWIQLARHMQHRLNIAEVNCDENSAFCQSQNVLGYPMLQYYLSGVRTEYTGGRNIDQLKAFAEKASTPGVQDLVIDDLESHIRNYAVVYLLLYSSSNSDIMNQVKQSSQILLGSPPIYASTSMALFNRFAVPTASSWILMAFKDHDATRATSSFYNPSASSPNGFHDMLSSWLLQNRLPTSIELTQDTFQSVMNAKHRPLVIIAAVSKANKERVAERMKEIGKVWNLRRKGGRDVVFAWMDADKWTKWLKSMYSIEIGTSEESRIVVVDHARLLYYDKDQSGQPVKLTSTSIFSVVDDVLEGTLSAKNSENLVERMARYLNDKMTGIELYVRNHTTHAVLFFGFALVLVFLAFKRFVTDGGPDEHRHGDMRKSNRLD